MAGEPEIDAGSGVVMDGLLTETVAVANRRWRPYVDGHFIIGESGRTLLNPADGNPLCEVEESSSRQVETAILAARRAFDDGRWTGLSAHERARFLFALADAIEKSAGELALVETLNAGKPLREAQFDVSDAVNCFRYYAGLIGKPAGQTVSVPAPAFSQTIREPIGVCAQIIPWNYPIQMAAWKLAPALAAGNTCVLKPSELTPLTAIMLMELIAEIGLPPGVVNLVTGDGPSAGLPLAESHLVDKIAFTGSGKTGRVVAGAALGNLKKVSLELGGKSPMLIFADSCLDVAVDYALYAVFCHAGQVCSAGSRFLVEGSIYDDFVERFVAACQAIVVGPGLDPQTEMGPVISKGQMNRVLDFIDSGRKGGAELLAGGSRLSGAKYGDGYYISPTVFGNVPLSHILVQEEIFGPVAVIERFASEQDAIASANATVYGLAAAVFTADVTRAYRVVKQLRSGVNWINGFHSCYVECPFGGYKQSGWGRECGTYGLEAYTEVKQISINLEPVATGWFKS